MSYDKPGPEDPSREQIEKMALALGVSRREAHRVLVAAAEVMPITGQTSDGFHTFDELYRHRMLLTAALFSAWHELDNDLVNPADPGEGFEPHKSRRHSDGTLPFGGGWLIVVATLPTGQISYHYQLEHWDLFKIPERELPAPFDGHDAAEAADRLQRYLEL